MVGYILCDRRCLDICNISCHKSFSERNINSRSSLTVISGSIGFRLSRQIDSDTLVPIEFNLTVLFCTILVQRTLNTKVQLTKTVRHRSNMAT